ncbi:MAG TPA: MFS transporter [Hyphomicrobiales bacterium]|nr:MFS transporter [Hyphomicrobiales bacterium]
MTTARISIDDVIERTELGRFRWGLYIACGVFLMLEGYDSFLIANLAPTIAKGVGIPIPAMGRVFSAQAVGFAIAYYTIPMVADYVGRRGIVLATSVLFAVFTWLTTQVHSLDGLIAIRFLVFFALGGALPNVMALISELLPKPRQGSLLTSLYIAYGIGAALAGWIGTFVATLFSWQVAFWTGAIVLLIAMPFFYLYLPESPRYLVLKNARDRRIGKTLQAIDPALRVAEGTEYTMAERDVPGIPLINLFRGGRAPQTLLLWLSFAAISFSATTLAVWLPSLFHILGRLDATTAARMVSVSAIGSICGPLLVTWLLNRVGLPIALALMAAAAAVAMWACSFLALAPALGWLFGFAFGLLTIGAQAGLNGLVAITYPTAMRSTGIGWATGCGRVTAIIGPSVAGAMLAAHWSAQSIYGLLAVPLLIGAVTIALLHWTRAEHVARPAT